MAKVMVSLPDDLFGRLDAEARRRSTTRSGFLADAARTELARRDPDAMRAATARMDATSAKYAAPDPAGDSADLVRADRDERDQRDRSRV